MHGQEDRRHFCRKGSDSGQERSPKAMLTKRWDIVGMRLSYALPLALPLS